MFKRIPTKFLFPVLMIIPLVAAGCAFGNLKKETKIIQESTILVGMVSSAKPCGDSPVIVAAYTKMDGRVTVAHYAALHEPGPYELIVPEGDYQLFAFVDQNRNLKYDGSEPAGQYRRAKILSAKAGGVVGDLDMVIPDKKGHKIDFPVGASVDDHRPRKFHFTSPGTLADLDDPIFSADLGAKGYWAPLEFYKQYGGNIYFTQNYQPEKIPILFVHGANGTPREWRPIVANIDQNLFQPWFYYYPSGASIESMSHLLFWKVFNLQRKYQFKTLYIAAHSMGGLVSRSFLVNFAQTLPIKIIFISISTPWGGSELAKSGVEYSPAVIPAWKEIQADSPFLDDLYDKKLPQNVDHYLLFSYRGNRNPFRPNNDNVVTLQSELDIRSQAEAKKVIGFNEDHESILSSSQLLFEFNAIMKTAHPQKGVSESNGKNMIRVKFSYDFPAEMPTSQPYLLLRSTDRKQEIILNLQRDSSGSKVGPIPPGTYDVSMVAHAFTPAPLERRVTIGGQTTPEVEFELKPQGILVGTITQAQNAQDQAGLIIKPDSGIKINAMTLQGKDVRRTLMSKKGDFNFYDQYLAGSDWTRDGYFYFFNLPEGEYALTIDAQGFRKYTTSCKIRPGQNYNLLNIKLQKNR